MTTASTTAKDIKDTIRQACTKMTICNEKIRLSI